MCWCWAIAISSESDKKNWIPALAATRAGQGSGSLRYNKVALLISKTLTALAYPLSVSLLLTLLGAVFVWRGQKRLAGLSLLYSFLVLWVPSMPAVSDYLRASLERRHLPVALEQVPKADAIVVLGGAVGAALPPRLTVDLSGASDRVLYAAQLYQAGKARIVIASGGNLPWQRKGPAEAYAMAGLLRAWSVPERALLLETASRNTYENAVNTKRLLGAHGLHQVLLVTSALHMPRALALFRALGMEATPAPTDFEVVESGDETLLRWLPDAGALEGSTRALKEYFGLGVYWVRGWL